MIYKKGFFVVRARPLTTVVALSVLSSAIAVEVTTEQAQRAARNWVRRSPVQMTAEFKSSEVRHAQTAKDDDGKALYHVVELDGGGFVVTSGDTELPPVIAFSANGTLDLSDLRNPLTALLKQDLRSRRTQIAKSQMKMLATSQATDEDDPSSSGSTIVDSGESYKGEWEELLEEPDPEPKSKGRISALTASSSISDVRVAPMVQSKWNQAQ